MTSPTSVRSELATILDRLLSKRILLTRLHYDEDCETTYGNYSFVRKATLDQVRAVAVKFLPVAGGPEDRAHLALRVARNFMAWYPMSHPNLLPLTGFHVSDDYSLILSVSPWAAGGHIEAHIERHSPDIETRIVLALDTAAGLKFLHDKKICHGALKPRNIVVFENGCAALCDVGLANAIEGNAGHTGLSTSTVRDDSPGTITYTSPELTLDTGALRTLSSDVWAWGCLLLEILTGICPYAACVTNGQLYGVIAAGKPPADVFELQLPSDLKTLLLRCWNVKVEDRPTMDECFTRLVIAEVVSPFVDQLQSQTLSGCQQVRALYNSQRLKTLEGESSSAQEALERAKDKLLQLENSFGVLWCDNTLASIHRSKGHYNSARILQECVLESFQGMNAEWGVASARYELGVLDAKQGRHDIARTDYQAALEAFQRLGDPSGVASCRRGIGLVEIFRGEYDNARDQLHNAFESLLQLDNQSGVALCHRSLGMLNFYQGNYDTARSQYLLALQEFQRLEDPSQATWCQRSIGLIDCALNKYDDARIQAKAALEVFKRLDDLSGIASCQYDRGVAAWREGDYFIARSTLQQALEAEHQLGNMSGVAYCKRELVEIEYAHYNFKKARSMLQETLEVFQSLGDLRGEAGSHHGFGLIDYEEHKYDDARTRFQKALELYKRLGSQSGAIFCQEALRKIQYAESKNR